MGRDKSASVLEESDGGGATAARSVLYEIVVRTGTCRAAGTTARCVCVCVYVMCVVVRTGTCRAAGTTARCVCVCVCVRVFMSFMYMHYGRDV
jgi:hypothetical protein